MANAPDLSVIIVNYNTRDLLRECLLALRHCAGVSLELIVVDNASADGSAEMVRTGFPEVVLIANAENRGFGAGCNQGLRVAHGRYALILNADARPQQHALARLVAFMDAHPEALPAGDSSAIPTDASSPRVQRT
ncbi:MAG: hypothetical protein KatS3mg021_0145 [Fimbriimonadales bacterium]|nr:MAG: hypothetical protein KatS3mg021_0145 [Fimbriimonadales bacterium]